MIYISASSVITCATCKYSKTSCKHVVGLNMFLRDSDEDLPSVLLPFSHVSNQEKKGPKHNFSCVSSETIPFDLPSDLSRVLLMEFCNRFNIQNGIAHLVPDRTSACSRCQSINWHEKLVANSNIVTNNCFIQAKGIVIVHTTTMLISWVLHIIFFLKCNTEECDGCVYYDGQKRCLLNMKNLLFTYEVLRQFMLHFLIGR